MERFSQFNMDEALMLWEIGSVTIMLVFLAVALVFLFVSLKMRSNSKENNRIRNLRRRSKEDPFAKKELEKILRKKKNRNKKYKI